MKTLSKQEFVIGFCSTILLSLKIGWWGILLSIITSILWACGGSFVKAARRFGVPLAVLIFTHNLWCLLGIFPLLIGDGYADPFSGDKGSWLGRLVSKYVSDLKTGGLITKLIVPMILQILWIPIFMLK